MSRKSDAPNDRGSAKKYISWLVNLGVVDKIYLAGSRSPKRGKEPHENSDWDFLLVTSIPKLKLAQPRVGNILHADLVIYDKDQPSEMEHAVEIYPNDEYKVLK